MSKKQVDELQKLKAAGDQARNSFEYEKAIESYTKSLRPIYQDMAGAEWQDHLQLLQVRALCNRRLRDVQGAMVQVTKVLATTAPSQQAYHQPIRWPRADAMCPRIPMTAAGPGAGGRVGSDQVIVP